MASSTEYQESILKAQNRQQVGRPRWRRCCATCDHLSKHGECRVHDDTPPIDFIEKPNDCEDYEEAIPF